MGPCSKPTSPGIGPHFGVSPDQGSSAKKFENLEQADILVKSLNDFEQALIYKALYLNGMRLDKANGLLKKVKKSIEP